MALIKILLTSVLSMLLAGTAFAQVGNNTSLLNPNLAGREELVAVPQLDEALVDAILDERPFLDMSELHALLSRSLSEAQLTALYAQLFIPINLNTATREAILAIPSVGDRIAREFEEYRPYKAIAQFRRELGKYVSDAEVAQLEQYVFVPLNLNTATPEDLLTIPGVGNRLLREFLEYRPYVNMRQFRREIGKYVSDEEVARLARYVHGLTERMARPRTLTMPMGGQSEPGPIHVVRRILLGLLLVGIVGTLTELYLLEHTEDSWQLLPLVLLGLSLGAILLWVVSPSRSTMRVFQAVMLLFLSSGVLGLYLHYRGNVEFELENIPLAQGVCALLGSAQRRNARAGAGGDGAPWARGAGVQLPPSGPDRTRLVRVLA